MAAELAGIDALKELTNAQVDFLLTIAQRIDQGNITVIETVNVALEKGLIKK